MHIRTIYGIYIYILYSNIYILYSTIYIWSKCILEDKYSYILRHIISNDPVQFPGEICKSGKSQQSWKALIKRKHHGDRKASVRINLLGQNVFKKHCRKYYPVI